MPSLSQIIATDADGKSVWDYPCSAVVKLTPSTGHTVIFPANCRDTTLYLDPASDLAELTVTLPADADSVNGQKCSVVTTQAIATLNVSGNPMGVISSMEAGQYTQFLRLEAGIWCTA